MAIQSSGAIALQDIEDEFGGTGSVSLSEYYLNGAYVASNNTSVPTSGAISLNDFYGTVRQFAFSITSDTQNANIHTLATSAGWDGSAPLITTVASNVWLWSDSTSLGGVIISGSFPSGLTLLNYGNIIGKGGDGGLTQGAAGSDGGPALTVASTGVTVANNSGAYIAGGGGGGGGARRSSGQWSGGGGGAGGGQGGGSATQNTTISGGAIGSTGGPSVGWTADVTGAQAGGDGAYDNESSSGNSFGRSGGGGGRILPGVAHTSNTGTTYSYGGGGGQQGGPGLIAGNLNRGGGGGGWGAAGGSATYAGGAAGAAISGSTVTLTNNGTIYGTT